MAPSSRHSAVVSGSDAEGRLTVSFAPRIFPRPHRTPASTHYLPATVIIAACAETIMVVRRKGLKTEVDTRPLPGESHHLAGVAFALASLPALSPDRTDQTTRKHCPIFRRPAKADKSLRRVGFVSHWTQLIISFNTTSWLGFLDIGEVSEVFPALAVGCDAAYLVWSGQR